MSYAFFAYLKFILKSTNQHGVHSPFVYDLVTKCFYDKKKYPEYNAINNFISEKEISTKQAQLLFRVGRYLNFKNALFFKDRNSEITKTLEMANAEINTFEVSGYYSGNQKSDLIYFNNIDVPYFQKQIEALLKNAHNDSLLLIQGIHSSKTAQVYWEHVKNHPKVTVTIDTFAHGFVFFRTEQAKEHFVIRV